MPDPTGQDRISQAEFIKNLKEQNPALAPFPDYAILERVLKEDPSVRDKIYTPDDVASAEQERLQRSSDTGYVAPQGLTDFWGRHPNVKSLAQGTLDTLPGIGAMVGGALATPETLGIGTVGGAMVGAGAGKGARDYLSQSAGLEDPNSALDKALGIGGDALLAGTLPGTIEAAIHPIKSSRIAAGMAAPYSNAFFRRMPSWLRPDIGGLLEDYAAGGREVMDPRVRPSWQVKSPFAEESAPSIPGATGTKFEGPMPSDKPTWVDLYGPPRPNIQGPSGTSMNSDVPLPRGPIPNMFEQSPRPNIQGPSGTSMGSDVPLPKGPIPNTFEQPATPTMKPSGSTRTPWGSSVPLTDEPTPFSARQPATPQTPGGPVEAGTTVKPDMSGKLDVTGKMKPIIQVDSDSGAMRGSVDGGKTWKYTTDNGKTWTEE